MYDVDRILADNSLMHIAELAGAEFHNAGSGEYRSHCPLHLGDNKSGFVIYDNEMKWACFTGDCGSGSVIDFVRLWKGMSFTEACEWLGGQHEDDPVKNEEIKRLRIEERNKRLAEEEARRKDLVKEISDTKNWLRYSDNLDESQKYQAIWEAQGIPPSWQSYWQLGYCKEFRTNSSAGLWKSDTLTIPIFSNGEIQNIRHRLLNPPTPSDKYRPERPGLGSLPFYCDSDKMYDFDRILYVEGEKKAMVTYLTLDSVKWQIIGIPGKNQWKKEIERLSGQKVFILLDPDALDQAREFAKATGGYYIKIPLKIDDAINDGLIDKNKIRALMKGAKREL